jgi:hypothetical protein
VTLPESELVRMHGSSDQDLSRWIDLRFPGGVTAQWWEGVFEGLEVGLSPARTLPDEDRRGALELAARLPVLAAERGEVPETYAAFWLLRFSADVIRLGRPRLPVPPLLAPDAAIRWALEHLPMALDEATAVLSDSPDGCPPPSHLRAVQESERVATALKWVVDAADDAELRGRAHAWIALIDG